MYECACRSGKIMTTGISTMSHLTMKMEVWKAGEGKSMMERVQERMTETTENVCKKLSVFIKINRAVATWGKCSLERFSVCCTFFLK